MWIKALEWNIREVQSSAKDRKKKEGKSLSCRERAKESEVTATIATGLVDGGGGGRGVESRYVARTTGL